MRRSSHRPQRYRWLPRRPPNRRAAGPGESRTASTPPRRAVDQRVRTGTRPTGWQAGLAKIDAAQARVALRSSANSRAIALTDDASMRDIETAAVGRRAGHRAGRARVGPYQARRRRRHRGCGSAANRSRIECRRHLDGERHHNDRDRRTGRAVRARVVPGAPASDTQAKLDAAQQVLTAALTACPSRRSSRQRASSIERRRRELVGTRDKLTATAHGAHR